jgi:hypothetical protein
MAKARARPLRRLCITHYRTLWYERDTMTPLAFIAVAVQSLCCAWQVLRDYLGRGSRWTVRVSVAVAVALYVWASFGPVDQTHFFATILVTGTLSILFTVSLIAAVTRQAVPGPVSIYDARQMTGDAIILERACRVLERRFGDMGHVPDVRDYLENMAAGLRDLAVKFSLRTKDGRLITDQEIQQWADEAERGYDISHLTGER